MSAALVEFLRARIADDAAGNERAIVGTLEELRRSNCEVPTRDELLAFTGDLRRRLQEVEAKRRIVAEIAIVTLSPEARSLVKPEYVKQLERFLSLLALPYADHPAYQHEWRP